MSPQLRHLRYFVAVAEEKSFTNAARRLCVAQQAVSSTIRQLELELGVPLLTRSTRRVELTPPGEVLLERGRVALESFDRAWNSVREPAQMPMTLSVAYDPIVGQTFVTGAHGLLVDLFPQLHASWRPRYNVDLALEVGSGRFDVGVALAPEIGTGLEFEIVGLEPLKVILGRNHALAKADAIELLTLEAERVFVLPKDLGPRFSIAVESAWEGRGTRRPRFVETPDPGGSATLEHYEQCTAVGLSTARVVDEFVQRHESIVCAVPLDADIMVPITVVWRPELRSEQLAGFMDVCRQLSVREPARKLHEADSKLGPAN